MGRAHGDTLPHFRRIFYPIFAIYGVKEKGSALKPSLFNVLELSTSKEMARVTGLEPATFGVTGRHSNQLSYTRAFSIITDREARLNKPELMVKHFFSTNSIL